MVEKRIVQLSVRTLKTMAKQGIGHSNLYEVAKKIQKNRKKSKK